MKETGMAKVVNATVALARLAQDREAIRVRAGELDAQEKELKKLVAREGATRLASVISGLKLGEVTKAQAVELGRHIQRLGLKESIDRLMPK